MKNLLKIMALCILVAMQSCSTEDEPQYMVANQPNSEISKMVVRFGGKVYETGVKETGDSVSYLNSEYAEVYRSRIANSEKIAAVLYSDEDGTTYVDYFTSEKELIKEYDFFKLENNKLSNMKTRADVKDLMPSDNVYPVIAKAALFRDSDFKNDELRIYATTKWANGVPNLKSISFNDRISSIKLINLLNPDSYYSMYYYSLPLVGSEEKVRIHKGDGLRPVLRCCQDANYKGSVIYCISSPSGSSVDHTDSNLKKIKFNDKISSVDWFIVYDFSQFKSVNGKDPQIPAHGDC